MLMLQRIRLESPASVGKILDHEVFGRRNTDRGFGLFRCAAYLIILALCACNTDSSSGKHNDPLIVQDVSRLSQTSVAAIVRPQTREEILSALGYARDNELLIGIAGTRHSQGGHIVAEGGLLLDMTDFDEILAIDDSALTVNVQSGATWKELQEALNPHGLAIKVMQSANVFSIGGTLACNAHGRDPNYGPIVETVRSLQVLNANGRLLTVDREHHPDLFSLVIGGYGLFGVILEVELEVTPNVLLQRRIDVVAYTDYPAHFRSAVSGNSQVALHSARLSIAPGNGFLSDLYAKSFKVVDSQAKTSPLNAEQNTSRDRFLMGLSRKFEWGKKLRWFLQRSLADNPNQEVILTRNNAMRPSFDFLRYESDHNTDILQEYFVPIDSFVPFVDALRKTILEYDVNLMHVTVRYVPSNDEAFLHYSPVDQLALVLYINIGLGEEEIAAASRWTRELVDAAHAHGGRYYLVYQGFPTREQSREAYPKLDEFFDQKKRFDPEGRFSNRFYKDYGPEGTH